MMGRKSIPAEKDSVAEGLDHIQAALQEFKLKPETVNRADRYVLLPESAFFEFIPVDRAEENAVLMGKLELGRKYEVVVTNRSGLYRSGWGMWWRWWARARRLRW